MAAERHKPSESDRVTRKTYFVKTYGCQMNVYDSERMGDVLEADGFASVEAPDAADVVILNTCHIREKASEKMYSDIGRLKRRDGPQPVIAVAGCVAQAEGEEIVRRAPAVSVVVGPQAYHRLPDMIARAAQKPVDVDLSALDKFKALGGKRRANPSSFLTIQEGCDKFCTYCVVPYTRGAEVSRLAATILEEARRLASDGAREIVLLGQNVNAYRDENGVGFADLIRSVAGISGIERVRYTTSHPADMDDSLIAAHGELDALMPYMHLPVQSGSDRILKAMNRSHTAASYLETIDKLRAARPDIAISGDFIVGFPGETDGDFEETLRIVEQVNYAQAYSFKYSPRPGTPAADMEGQISEEIKDERLQRLQAVLNAQQLAFNGKSVGTFVDILLERSGKRAGQLIGRTPWLQSVHIDAAGAAIGDIVRVKIVSAGPRSLRGERQLAAAA